MAGQFHVAFSTSLRGAAIVAGGPYDCAGGSIAFAMQRCMETNLGTPDPARLLARARDRASRGEIDPLDGLLADKVYVFSGTRDTTVTPPVVAEAWTCASTRLASPGSAGQVKGGRQGKHRSNLAQGPVDDAPGGTSGGDIGERGLMSATSCSSGRSSRSSWQ